MNFNMDDNNILSGVDCTVKECYYHSSDNKCTADSIQVNGMDSRTSDETECSTFKPESMS